MTDAPKLLTEAEWRRLLAPHPFIDDVICGIRERGLIAPEPVDPLLDEAREMAAVWAETQGFFQDAKGYRSGKFDNHRNGRVLIALAALKRGMELAQPTLTASPRFPVPDGQTPLDDNLRHRYLDVIREGSEAFESRAPSPYHGHSLEHCLHAQGWVQRDLRVGLDKAKATIAALTKGTDHA